MSSPVSFASAWPEQQAVTPVWTAFGHSFINFTTGTRTQMGRIDSLFRSAMRIENSNWANYAQNGARLVADSMWNNGWIALWYETMSRGNSAAWPYIPEGGGLLSVHGINDLGNLTNTLQTRTAWQHCNRALISRWRASAIRLNTHSSIAYGAGFTSVTGQEERSTTGTLRQSTAVGGTNTITITLPSDYKGEPVALCLIGRAGTVGGTVTLSGSALSGKPESGTTISTSNIMPSGTFYVPVVKRITSLTSANAGQQIIMTTSQMDASGNVLFDTYWLESLTPQPVIVANIPRMTATAYANYYGSWTGTESSKDADVVAWNQALADVVAEFGDPMVQIADFDRALNKDPDLMAGGSDNQLHPNEWGAARCTDALVAAARKLKPVPSRVSKYGTAASYNPSAPAGAANRLPQNRVGYWYGSQFKQIASTGVTMVSGDFFAYPFVVTEPDTRFDLVGVEVQTAGAANNLVRIGYFLDLRWSGYPGRYVTEWTGSGLNVGTSTNWKTASIVWEPDPGFYFIGLKITTVTATAPVLRATDGPCPYMPTVMSTGGGANPSNVTTSPVAWRIQGQGTGSFPTRFPTTATPIDRAPLVVLRRSAAA